jgi:putative nucleotidyltransferase with HDIG domain
MIEQMRGEIGKIRELVKSEAMKSELPEQWECHVLPVVNYAIKLSDICNADRNICEVAALLHDIGRIRYGSKDHNITGARDSEKILSHMGFEKEFVEKVKHCIISHRCNDGDEKPKTLEAKIISSADAMAQYDNMPLFFYIPIKIRNENLIDAYNWVYEKVIRGWEKKMLIPQAKEMMKEKHEAIKTILEASKQYIDKL